MKVRFARKCKHVKGKPVVKMVKMSYGWQVMVTMVCPVCGRIYRELPGKGPMITDMVDAEKPEDKPVEQVIEKEEKIREKVEKKKEKKSVKDKLKEIF